MTYRVMQRSPLLLVDGQWFAHRLYEPYLSGAHTQPCDPVVTSEHRLARDAHREAARVRGWVAP